MRDVLQRNESCQLPKPWPLCSLHPKFSSRSSFCRGLLRSTSTYVSISAICENGQMDLKIREVCTAFVVTTTFLSRMLSRVTLNECKDFAKSRYRNSLRTPKTESSYPLSVLNLLVSVIQVAIHKNLFAVFFFFFKLQMTVFHFVWIFDGSFSIVNGFQ